MILLKGLGDTPSIVTNLSLDVLIRKQKLTISALAANGLALTIRLDRRIANTSCLTIQVITKAPKAVNQLHLRHLLQISSSVERHGMQFLNGLFAHTVEFLNREFR